MAEIPLMLEGRKAGSLNHEEENGRVFFRAQCPYEEGQIYRVYLSSAGAAEDLYLGLMMPEGSRFVLRKELPAAKWTYSENARAYIRRDCIGEEAAPPLPFSFSRFVPVGKAHDEEHDEIEEMFRACGGMGTSFGGKRYYAVEGRPGREFPLPGLFCLFTYMEYGSRGYWVLCVDENRRIMPII